MAGIACRNCRPARRRGAIVVVHEMKWLRALHGYRLDMVSWSVIVTIASLYRRSVAGRAIDREIVASRSGHGVFRSSTMAASASCLAFS